MRVSGAMRDVVVDGNGRLMTRNNDELADRRLRRVLDARARATGGWILLSIEQDAEGAHNLDAPIVASPWSDEARLHDEAVTELAVADAAPNVAELADVDFDGDARAAALDLSNADGRFAPRCSRRRRAAPWRRGPRRSTATTRALEAIATPDAVAGAALRRRREPQHRLVVRGPKLSALRIAGLDAAHEPPTMTVEAERRRPPLRRGSRHRRGRCAAPRTARPTFTERWTMALDGDPETPWRIAAA